jgi:ribosomal protein L37AE/L43A
MKISVCPRCRSKDIELYMPDMRIYRCRTCGYVGGLVIEEEVVLDGKEE